MAQSLPESLDLLKAVTRGWCYSGRLNLSDFSRLPENIIKKDAELSFKIEFLPYETLAGQAFIEAETQVELICQRSLDSFTQRIRVKQKVGFIRNLDDEQRLGPDMNPSLVEDGLVQPKELIEDELLLAIPEFPVMPGVKIEQEYAENEAGEAEDADSDNPFSVLKELKS
ncbi:YceD family protein [Marinicella sp. W31]|uniref:YceD family protein n=1 Tax=Marinicella sp. W31 TaxID=3023713 RepID=UPI003756763E